MAPKEKKEESADAEIYVLSDDELKAIADARSGGFAARENIDAFWKRHGLASLKKKAKTRNDHDTI